MDLIDLRSDTVTLPTAEMRKAMWDAELGDDVLGDDPTVNRLQDRAAEMMGKEAALFVPSGTMGNRLGIFVNAPYGHALIADAQSHAFLYEAGGAATLGGVQVMPITTPRGIITPEQIAAALPPDDPHFAPIAAVTVENTHNRHGGVVWPSQQLFDVYSLAHDRGLRVHLDGARIFNAAIATATPVSSLTAGADTVTFCLSKGLACPVGSLFCASTDVIHEARRWRKMLGGGMRQAGVVAAAGLVALDTMIERLADDHANARTLAEAIAEMPHTRSDLSRVETNMVFFDVPDAAHFVDACAESGVLGLTTSPTRVRFVTHHGIDAGDIQRAVTVCGDVLKAWDGAALPV